MSADDAPPRDLDLDLAPELLSLLRSYAALVPPRDLAFPHETPFAAVHDFLLAHILANPHFARYPSSARYQAAFWKWALAHLEAILADTAGTHDGPAHDLEISAALYDRHIALLSTPS